MKRHKIGVIGLGYVGLPLAVRLAEKFETVGFDINEEKIKSYLRGEDSTHEIGTEALLQTNLWLTTYAADLADCTLYIVTVPTPVLANHAPDFSPLQQACKLLANYLKKGDLVVFESTVYPGATEEICVPLLAASGLQFGIDFEVGYSPERVNPGDKVHSFQRVTKIISASSEEALQQMEAIYGAIIEAGTHRMSSIRSAEAVKVIENTQRDVNIAFMNEVAQILHALQIETQEVLEAAGTKWNALPFQPGLVGGHCIGVDPYYLIHQAQKYGVDPHLMQVSRATNNQMPSYIATQIMTRLGAPIQSDLKVGILGLTFKENCPDFRNSKVFDLIEELQAASIQVQAYDPYWTSDTDIPSFVEVSSFEKWKDLDALIIAVKHDQFYDLLTPLYLKQLFKLDARWVFDLKGLFEQSIWQQQGLDVWQL